MQRLLPTPRLCAGVDRAIDIVNPRLDLRCTGLRRHEVVHNKIVVNDLGRGERCSGMS